MRIYPGARVAWQMLDGHTMAGTVEHADFALVSVKRVDGGLCTIRADRLRLAMYEDIESAISFYAEVTS